MASLVSVASGSSSARAATLLNMCKLSHKNLHVNYDATIEIIVDNIIHEDEA